MDLRALPENLRGPWGTFGDHQGSCGDLGDQRGTFGDLRVTFGESLGTSEALPETNWEPAGTLRSWDWIQNSYFDTNASKISFGAICIILQDMGLDPKLRARDTKSPLTE